MDKEELQQKSDADLKGFISEKREELRTLRFSGAGSGMRDTKSISRIKKDVARALTEMNSRNRKEANA